MRQTSKTSVISVELDKLAKFTWIASTSVQCAETGGFGIQQSSLSMSGKPGSSWRHLDRATIGRNFHGHQRIFLCRLDHRWGKKHFPDKEWNSGFLTTWIEVVHCVQSKLGIGSQHLPFNDGAIDVYHLGSPSVTHGFQHQDGLITWIIWGYHLRKPKEDQDPGIWLGHRQTDHAAKIQSRNRNCHPFGMIPLPLTINSQPHSLRPHHIGICTKAGTIPSLVIHPRWLPDGSWDLLYIREKQDVVDLVIFHLQM